MASGFEMRVGHAERDAVATELREHYAAGRITLDELNERLDKTFAAKTRADLKALMTDLPSASGSGTGSTTGSTTGSGPRMPLAAGAADWNSGQGSGWGAGCGHGARRRAEMAFGAVLSGLILVAALLTLGGLSLFGIGTGRPFGIVLILAALAFLRRIFFRRGPRRGPARGRGPRRRW